MDLLIEVSIPSPVLRGASLCKGAQGGVVVWGGGGRALLELHWGGEAPTWCWKLSAGPGSPLPPPPPPSPICFQQKKQTIEAKRAGSGRHGKAIQVHKLASLILISPPFTAAHSSFCGDFKELIQLKDVFHFLGLFLHSSHVYCLFVRFSYFNFINRLFDFLNCSPFKKEGFFLPKVQLLQVLILIWRMSLSLLRDFCCEN